MKKSFYKIISCVLCAILLSFQILFGLFNVRSYAIDTPIIIDNFNDTVPDIISSMLGYVWDNSVDIGHEVLEFLGLEEEDDQEEYLYNHYIIDDPAPGQAGRVKIDNTLKNDLTRFVDNYRNSQAGYVYSLDFNNFRSYFSNDLYFQEFREIIAQNPGKLCVFANYYYADREDISVATLGRQAPRLYVFNEFSFLEFNALYTEDNLSFYYNMSPMVWNAGNPQLTNYNTSACLVYGVWESGDMSITSKYGPNYFYTAEGYNILAGLERLCFGHTMQPNSAQRGYAVSVDRVMAIPHFNNVQDATNNNGQPSYYTVPTQNWSYDGGYYSITTTQLDNSITYGDIQSYVNEGNSNYSEVINYIENFYNGEGGEGGEGSGGEGSDIDWSWLGKIGEVIGGLISALGNVIAGIIDGITDLITSLTENLPNVFSSIIEWLLPFLPEEVTSLISLLFMAIILVGVVRLIRGK